MGKRFAVVAVLVLVPGFLVFARHRRLSNDAVERIVAATSPRARPVHREPAIDSTFEAELAPLLDAPPAWGVFGPAAGFELTQQADDVVAGRKPFDTLPPAFVADAVVARSWFEQVMACSRAKASGEADGHGLLADPQHPRMQVSWYLPLRSWGPLEVRRVLTAGDAAGALRWCADLLATARDVTRLRPGLGLEFALDLSKRLVVPCEDALRTAEPADRARFQAELARLRAGVPTLRELLERKRARDSLQWWGGFLLQGELARLPAAVRPWAGDALAGEWPRRRAGLYLAWAELEASRQVLMDAADAPDRGARFEAELQKFHPLTWATGESWFSGALDDARAWDAWVAQLEQLSRPLE